MPVLAVLLLVAAIVAWLTPVTFAAAATCAVTVFWLFTEYSLAWNPASPLVAERSTALGRTQRFIGWVSITTIVLGAFLGGWRWGWLGSTVGWLAGHLAGVAIRPYFVHIETADEWVARTLREEPEPEREDPPRSNDR